jgi:MFS family permease
MNMEEGLTESLKNDKINQQHSMSQDESEPNVESLSTNSEKNMIPSDLEKDKPLTDENEFQYDVGYAWVIVFGVFLLNFSTWGMNSGFAIYFSYYLNNDTFEGASKLDYSAIGGIAFGGGLLFSPFINYLQGRIGTRPLIMLGNCLQFMGLMMASFSVSRWQLYMTQGVINSFGLACISLPGITLLPQYFKKRRTLLGGLATAGSGVGGIVFNLGMQKVIQTRDVFWALRCQSIIAFGLVWIAVAILRSRSKNAKIEFTIIDMQCLRCTGFWFFVLYVITCMFAYVVVLYTLVNFTTSLGYSEYEGSIVSAMVQLGSCIGRPLVGLTADKIGSITMALIAYTLCAIFALAMWIPARNYATIIVFALIMGSLMGSIYGTVAPSIARLVGMNKLNVTFCMLWMFLGGAGIASPVIGVSLKTGGGGFVDATQYVYCSVFAGVSFAVCALSLLLLRGYVLGRDTLVDAESDSDYGGHLSVRVPLGLALRSCFKWTPRRA